MPTAMTHQCDVEIKRRPGCCNSVAQRCVKAFIQPLLCLCQVWLAARMMTHRRMQFMLLAQPEHTHGIHLSDLRAIASSVDQPPYCV